MKIENSKGKFFSSKEQFQQFRQSWKDFHRDGKHNKVEKTTWDGVKYKESDLLCVHHLIYALLRGRDISKSFVSADKRFGTDPYSAFYKAKSVILSATVTRFHDKYTYLFLPFGDTVNMELLHLLSNEIKDMKL